MTTEEEIISLQKQLKRKKYYIRTKEIEMIKKSLEKNKGKQNSSR
jgi:hypothetical protein